MSLHFNWEAWRMNFKEKLVYVRAYLNLTQAQLAKELNVSFETIKDDTLEETKPTEIEKEVNEEIFLK